MADPQLDKDRLRYRQIPGTSSGSDRKGTDHRGEQVWKKIESIGDVLYDNSSHIAVIRHDDADCPFIFCGAPTQPDNTYFDCIIPWICPIYVSLDNKVFQACD